MGSVKTYSLFSDFDIDLFRGGKHFRLYEKLGSHCIDFKGESGVYFAVYAPAARQVSVIGDFNAWNSSEHLLNVRWDSSGIWEGFIPDVGPGSKYKYAILPEDSETILEKGDPFARLWEIPPLTASIVHQMKYSWGDHHWMDTRKAKNALNAPLAVYEIHPGSWKWNTEEKRHLNWEELRIELPLYVEEMGFTHVEFMPIMEYPYEPSWGYQITGYFASSSRFGSPEGLAGLIDELHQKNIGVILDWVPSHFPSDAHGLGKFDGSHVYEHPDPRKGYHPDWKSLIFNYDRPEVRSFLISNALFWLDQFHADGLRVDAVASMLYLDYSRDDGEWEPNAFGGRENLGAITFLKDLNTAVYSSYPGVQTIAEESTSFPRVTSPVDHGGLGFGMKWMMGWMNDNLLYFQRDPIHRKYHHNEISFSLTYAFSENFMLPLSHDEVVHGKKSLLRKMPGDDWQQFANLKLLYAWMYTHPGTKLLFQGAEFGQSEEWNFANSLDWNLLDYAPHKGIQAYVRDLNHVYTSNAELFADSFEPSGFEWIDLNDSENSVISFLRKSDEGELLIALNLTGAVLRNYRIGSPKISSWNEVFNSDDPRYGGNGVLNKKKIITQETGWHGRAQSISIDLPPLGAIILKPQIKEN